MCAASVGDTEMGSKVGRLLCCIVLPYRPNIMHPRREPTPMPFATRPAPSAQAAEEEG
jgi:hypothetical protein